MGTQYLEVNALKNVLMTKILLFFGILIASTICHSQQVKEKTSLANDNDEIQVTSETLNYYNQDQKRMAIFEGNVHVTRGDMTMTSKKMTCYLNSKNEIHLIIAEGDVVITQKESKATSEKVAYSPDENKIILIKKPIVYMNGSTIHARRITIYQETGDIFFDEPIMNTIINDEQAK